MRLAGKHAVITGGAASGLRMWAISRLSSAQTERGGHLNGRTTRSRTRLRPLLMRWCKLLQLYQAHPQTDPREGAQPHARQTPDASEPALRGSIEAQWRAVSICSDE